MRSTIECKIYKGEKFYIAECLDFPVITQGATIDEAVMNIQDAISLHLEGEDLREFGFVESPRLDIRIEVEELTHVAQA